MKRSVLRAICLSLAVGILLTFCSCKKVKEEYYTSSIVEIVDDADNGENSGTSDSSNQTGKSSDKSGNSTKSSSSSKTSVSTGKLSSVPKSLKGSTVVVYTWNNLNDVPGAANTVKKFKKETGINVSWKVGSYDNYKSEIAAMVSANNSPDVIRLRGVEPGILTLMDPVTATGYDFKDEMWSDFVSKTYTFNGKTYAVNRSNTLLQQPMVMMYNRDLITKYDLDDPYSIWKRKKSDWNWDRFFSLCEAYKNNYKGTGVAIPWALNGYKDYAMTFGGDLIKRQGDKFVVNDFNSGNVITGFQKMAELLNNNTAAGGWDVNGFNTGKYLFWGPAIISARRTHFDLTDLKAKGSLGAVPYPCVSGQSAYYQNIWEVEAYGIPKGAKNAAAVPYFLATYLDGDNYDANSFFNDKTILDVYKYCMNETTLVPEYDRYLFQLDLGGTEYSDYSKAIFAATPQNVPTELNKYSSVINRAVNQANDAIQKLK